MHEYIALQDWTGIPALDMKYEDFRARRMCLWHI